MNIISGQNVDLLMPFPQGEVPRMFGWRHCYRTLSDDDDSPEGREEFIGAMGGLLPGCLSVGIIDKCQLTSTRHEAPLVGMVFFIPGGERDGVIHFAAGRKAFKMGLVEEAMAQFIPEIFAAYPSLLRVSALLDESNTPAKGVLKRLGWKFEGVAQDACLQGGVPRSRVMFGLTRRVAAGPEIKGDLAPEKGTEEC